MNYEQLTQKILEGSTLASELAQLIEDISCSRSSRLCINGALDVSIMLPVDSDHHEIHNATVDPKHYPHIRPYHAVLLKTDPEDLLRKLPLDPSPLLVKFIEIVSPTQR